MSSILSEAVTHSCARVLVDCDHLGWCCECNSRRLNVITPVGSEN